MRLASQDTAPVNQGQGLRIRRGMTLFAPLRSDETEASAHHEQDLLIDVAPDALELAVSGGAPYQSPSGPPKNGFASEDKTTSPTKENREGKPSGRTHYWLSDGVASPQH